MSAGDNNPRRTSSTETARIRAVQNQMSVTPQELLRGTLQRVDETIELAREYQAGLRAKGMTLPSGTMESLQRISERLNALLRALASTSIQLRQLRALAETTSVFNSDLDVDGVLEQVMDTVVQLTGAERGFVLLSDPESGELEFRTARGIDREQLNRDDFTVSRTIINEVQQTGLPVRTESARDDPRYGKHESVVGYQLRSILAVPLKVQDELIGVVYCDNRVLSGLFRDHELQLLAAFADQAAVAIQNARLFSAARAQLAAITAMRDLMDSVFASIASGLIALDENGVITIFNAAAETITGFRAAQALGEPVENVLPGFERQFAAPLRSARAGQSAELETEIALPELGMRIWRVHISPLRDTALADKTDLRGAGVAILLEDLTEEREREAQLAHVRPYLPPALVENIRSEDLAALGGVEREITCLFADVRGFTSFSERLEPEDLLQIINQYLSVASDSINLFEGVVDKYIGDAVTGLFNTQLNPQADHALRAVRAALSLRYDIAALHEVLPEAQRLLFGIGIHTGLAVLGNVGSKERREFAAIGDAVDFARLLQENAHRGEILLSAETYALVQDYLECEPIEPRKTKGRADFTVAYKVVRLRRRER